MPNEFTCSVCGNTYEKGRSDEEAVEELSTHFPGFEVEDCDVVCDNCFKQMGLDNVLQ